MLESVIDVVPLGPGNWLARCECGVTERFPDPESGWAWVLGHPCDSVEDAATESHDSAPEPARPATIDLTGQSERTPGRCG